MTAAMLGVVGEPVQWLLASERHLPQISLRTLQASEDIKFNGTVYQINLI